MSLFQLVAVAIVAVAATPNFLVAEENSAAAQLHQLFADDWQWRLDNYPTLGTSIGDPRGNDKWTDLSQAAIDQRDKHPHQLL